MSSHGAPIYRDRGGARPGGHPGSRPGGGEDQPVSRRSGARAKPTLRATASGPRGAVSRLGDRVGAGVSAPGSGVRVEGYSRRGVPYFDVVGEREGREFLIARVRDGRVVLAVRP